MIKDDKKLAEILKRYDDDKSAQQPIRDERIMDLSFARLSQNDDEMAGRCTTEFVGEFNIIGRERKAIQAEFKQNQIEVKFRSKSEDNDDLDELVQGKYRTDRRLSKSKQAFEIAQDDVIDCGFGAWRLHTVEEDDESELNANLEIRRSPIVEAVRNVFFDSSSVLADKSDAEWCSVIVTMDESRYKKYLGSVDAEASSFTSFDGPYQSIYETWYGTPMMYPLYSAGKKEISLLEHYEIDYEKEKFWLYLALDDDGKEILKPIAEKEAKEMGFPEPFRKKTVKKQVCYKYVTNGVEILEKTKVAGGNIPIIPFYGERNFVNGVENFYGIVKAAKDPQALMNFAMNYMSSLLMFSPVPKPVYDPREIEGFEEDYDDINNHELAYMRKNKSYTNADGRVLQFPPEYTQPAAVPPALSGLMQILPSVTDSILNPGVTEDSFSSNMSGVALQQVKEQVGVMRYIFLDNFADAMRRDGEIYSAMLADVFDTPRKLVVTNPDGTTTVKPANEEFYNPETMRKEFINKLEGAKFNVLSDIGPSHQSQREAALANLKELFQSLPQGDPMQRVVMLAILSKQDGEGLDDINKAARLELLGMGIPGIEPQTDEEIEYLQTLQQQQAQQQGQPDPMVMAAMAEMEKAKAQQMEAQIKQFTAQSKAQHDQAKVQVDAFEAQTDRMTAQVKAQETGASISNKEADTLNKAVEAQIKQADLIDKEMGLRVQNMPTEELIRLMDNG